MVPDFTKAGRLSAAKAEFDIIVVGSGHNGLVAAAYLAKAGKKVLVVERQSYPGGGVASLSMTEPGYTSERHSTIHTMILANPLITKDELHLQSKYGLEYLPINPPYAIIFENGVLPIYKERQRTVDAIVSISNQKEGNAYVKFADMAEKITSFLMPGMFVPPSNSHPAVAPEGLVLETIESTSKASSVEIIEKYFTDPTIKVAILRFISEIQLADPRTPGNGLMAYLAIGVLEKYGVSIPRGGGTAFTRAVISSLEADGGQLWLNTEVTKILTENGRAVGIRTRSGEVRAREGVIAQIHPHLLTKFIDGIDPSIAEAARRTKSSEYSVFMIHAALEKPLRFKAGGIANTSVMNTICPNNVEDMFKSYDALNQGKIPDGIMVGGASIDIVDPTRAPPGKALLHLSVMVPANLAKHGWNGWDDCKDEVVTQVLTYLERFAVDFKPDQVRSYHVVTPPDHQSDSPSFQHGDICGIAMTSDQMGMSRPTPALAQYRVPGVLGLYLAGPFMHPGGGVWGGGRPVAMRVLEDLGIDFHAVVDRTMSHL